MVASLTVVCPIKRSKSHFLLQTKAAQVSSYPQLNLWAPSPAVEIVSSISCSSKCELQPAASHVSSNLQLPCDLQPAAAHMSSNPAASNVSFNLQLFAWALTWAPILKPPTWDPTRSCSLEFQPAAAHVSSNLHLLPWSLTCGCLRELQPASAHVSSKLHLPKVCLRVHSSFCLSLILFLPLSPSPSKLIYLVLIHLYEWYFSNPNLVSGDSIWTMDYMPRVRGRQSPSPQG